MKLRMISLFLVFILGASGVVGFFSVGSMEHEANHMCPLQVIPDNACPTVNNIFSFAVHHLNALQRLTQSVFNASTSVMLALMFTMVLLLVFVFRAFNQNVYAFRHSIFKEKLALEPASPLRQLLFWSALHNKRPASDPVWGA